MNVKTLAAIGCTAALVACTEPAESGAAGAETETAATADTGEDGNWVRTVSRTDVGGYLMGSPNAPVKLVEYASLTCPHCADFHETAMAELKGDYIATGQVSYELRNFYMNPADIAATLLTRCTTPEAYFALTDLFFEQQQAWLEPFTTLDQAQLAELQSMPPSQAMARYAELGNLDDFVRARGLPASKVQQCLADEEELETLEAIRQRGIAEDEVAGTPSFTVNGEPVGSSTWPDVKARLDAVL